MLATIDEETAAKVDRDRKVHGAAFTCVLPDGSIAHVPADDMLPYVGAGLLARLQRLDPNRTYRIARVATDLGGSEVD